MSVTSESLTPLIRAQLSAVFQGGSIDAGAVREEAKSSSSQLYSACFALTTAVLSQLDKISRSPSIAHHGGDVIHLNFPGVVNDVMNPPHDKGGPGGSAVDGTTNFAELRQWAKKHLGVELERGSSIFEVRVTLPSSVIVGAQAEYVKITGGPELPPIRDGGRREFERRAAARHPMLQVGDARGKKEE